MSANAIIFIKLTSKPITNISTMLQGARLVSARSMLCWVKAASFLIAIETLIIPSKKVIGAIKTKKVINADSSQYCKSNKILIVCSKVMVRSCPWVSKVMKGKPKVMTKKISEATA